MSVGFRILQRLDKVPHADVERFRALPVANVSDIMSRMFSGGTQLRPMHRSGAMAGPALTVRTRPGDNLMVHKALDMAEPGDVIVVDGGGDLTNALIGELMVTYAVRRQLGGIVVHGAIRDHAAIREGLFPVFAAGVTHRGPYKDGPGEINVPIAINDMVIAPGDLILGDDDGLLCVPLRHIASIYDKAKSKYDSEQLTLKDIAEGRYDRSWIDDTLTRLGCEIEGTR